MSEYNRDPRESARAREELRSAAEYGAAAEQRTYSENKSVGESARREKRKGSGASALSRLFAGFAVVAVVAASATFSGALAPAKGSAEIVSVTVTDTAVDYDVTVTEGEDLVVVLYNDFTRREIPLGAGENAGTFEELKPGVSYTLAVTAPAPFGSERTVAEQKVKTDLLPPPAPLSVWKGVASRCTCGIDGYFHFTMEFDDPNGYFTDFSASLEDAAGNVSRCVFTEDLHAEQSIDVTLSAHLAGKTATFTLTFRTADPSAEEQTVRYSCEVKI